jgi:replicative DNA helicase
MEHLEDNNLLLILFSLEMKKTFIMSKLLSIYIHEHYNIDLSMKELLSRKKGYRLSDENMKIVKECIPWLEKVKNVLHIYDGSLNSDKMYATLLNELENEGTFTKDNHTGYISNNPNKIILAILDHAGLIQSSKGRSKKEEIDKASHMIVSLRNRTDLSMLWLMQSNRAVAGMDRKKQGFNEPIIEDIKDSGSPSEDAEIVLSIYNPNKDHLVTYRGYDIKQMGENFRSILCLKSRYGESNAADCCFFNGKVNVWEELPKPNEIYDYSKYSIDKKEEIKDVVKENNKKIKFTI